MRDRKQTVETNVPEFIREMLVKIARERHKTLSNVVADIIIKQLATKEYEVLTKTEKQYVALKLVDIETDMLKYIRSKNAEKICFLNNIKKQIFRFTTNTKDVDKKDVIKNMKISLQIAQANHWTNETKKIKEFLDKAKNHNYRLEEKNDIKKIE